MMFFNNWLSTLMMNLTSSISVGNNSFLLATVKSKGFGGWLIEFLAKAVYTVCKWAMYIIDVIFFYIRQLSGVDVDTTSLDTITSGDTDLFFNILNNNSVFITQIIRQLVGLVFVVIIIVTIIALIKAHYKTMETGEPANNTAIIKNTLRAVIMIFITPMIAFGGVVMSNILLQALSNATNVTGTSSLGSSIFAISASAGNQYRIYGQSGKRIPIYFEFSQQEEILGALEKEELTQKGIDYLTSKNNPAYQTHLMFYDETYYLYDDIAPNSEYYETYDQKQEYHQQNNLYKRIRSYQEEYLVMADMVDYAVKNSGVFYFKTIEEILDTATYVSNKTSEPIKSNIQSRFSISETSELITFYGHYYTYDEETMEGSLLKEIAYNHVKGSTDELEGAVFIVTVEKQISALDPITNEMITYSYYEPVCSGTKTGSALDPFESSFLGDGTMVVAKGLFTNDGLPTAIRKSKISTDIQFYRDELHEYDIGDISNMGQFYVEEQNSGGIFSGIIQFFQMLFNPSSMVPKLDVDTDAVKVTYKKETTQAAALNNGRLHVSYLFNKSDSFKTSEYTIQIYNFYNATKFNFLILTMGTWLLLKAIAFVVFALIKRLYELFLLFLFYPTACAITPLDEGAGYNKWLTKFISKLFSAYATILGINFVLMIGPLAEKIQFFTPGEVISNNIIKRVGGLFFSLFSVNQIAKYLNIAVAVLFQLVAFSFLSDSGITKLMSSFFPGEEDLSSSNAGTAMVSLFADLGKLSSNVMKVFGGIVGVASVPIGMFSEKKRKEYGEKLKSNVKRIVPGSAIYRDVADKAFVIKKFVDQQKAMSSLKESFDSSSSSKDEVAKKFEAYMKSRTAYTKSLDSSKDKYGFSNTTLQRRAERDKAKEEKYKIPESSNSRADKETFEARDKQMNEDIMGSSDEELEEYIKENEQFVDKNEGKWERGKLKGKKKFNYYNTSNKVMKAKAELEKRKIRNESMNNLTKVIEDLENKKKSGPLSAAEENLLQQSKSMYDQYNQEIDQEKESYELKHDKKRQKQHQREQEQKEKDALIFRHKAKGSYKRAQNKRMKEINEDIVNAGTDLVSNGVGNLVGKSIPELNAELARTDISAGQKKAIQTYKEALEYREKIKKINEQEYENAAAKSADIKNKKTNKKLTNRHAFTEKGRQKKRDRLGRKLNLDTDQLQDEVSRLDSEISTLDDSYDKKDMKKRQKLLEERARIQQEIAMSTNFKHNNTEEGLTRLKEEKKAKKKFAKADKRHNLSEQAINYLTSKKIPVTQENIDKYLDALNQHRIANGKKPYF